ncbi:MAG: hypothetical protein GF364_13055 [Candidatus Lokiarchaeota archaeon]|nr:hypothetical protein [Candidatus Lokiarchaeota archaeon]
MDEIQAKNSNYNAKKPKKEKPESILKLNYILKAIGGLIGGTFSYFLGRFYEMFNLIISLVLTIIILYVSLLIINWEIRKKFYNGNPTFKWVFRIVMEKIKEYDVFRWFINGFAMMFILFLAGSIIGVFWHYGLQVYVDIFIN